jgi:hypothetical protein
MGRNVKLLDFDRGCNSIQNQLLNFFLPRLIGVREVAGSNPVVPTNSIEQLRLSFAAAVLAVADVSAITLVTEAIS